jgi:hypothetical protein
MGMNKSMLFFNSYKIIKLQHFYWPFSYHFKRKIYVDELGLQLSVAEFPSSKKAKYHSTADEERRKKEYNQQL